MGSYLVGFDPQYTGPSIEQNNLPLSLIRSLYPSLHTYFIVPYISVGEMSMQNQPAGVPDAMLRMKEATNDLYKRKSFTVALDLYSKILNNSELPSSDDTREFLRTVRSNRAASYIALATSTRKAHLRLARCFYELGKYEDATKHLDVHRAFVGDKSASEEELRNKILKAQSNQQSGSSSAEEMTVPLKYIVHISQSTPTAAIELNETVPLSLCNTRNPPEIPTKKLLANLVEKHHAWLLKQGPLSGGAWKCWSCGKRATGMVHTPASYLHTYLEGNEATIVDFTQPVHANSRSDYTSSTEPNLKHSDRPIYWPWEQAKANFHPSRSITTAWEDHSEVIGALENAIYGPFSLINDAPIKR
ncbi:unnamed protein product [Cyclocybe aegerita]|uniref:Uncharacterized protein n=1 Tax=Cyclocybe aegerita TaxID=1973307 RepID=A0A8S0X7G4_CYCAE|nr:unnamed protein product [Cyclocybe aegerita]